MIIPFAAGGPTDVLGRIVGARMSEMLGQQVVIENVGGAGGMTGSKRVADAQPDGYTIGIGTVGTHAQGQTLYKRPLYNSQTDFTPVALLAQVPIVLTVRKDLPAKDFKEFVAYAKANQTKMQFGSAGAGSATHLGCVLLNYILKTNITHIPFRGTGPAMAELQAGRIDFLCEVSSTAKPHIDGGTVRALAIFNSDALAGAAEPADRGRAGHQGPDRLHLERDLPAEEHAGADRRAAEQGGGRCDQHAGGEGQARRSRRRDRNRQPDHAGLSRQARQGRDREVGGADQGERRLGGLTARSRDQRNGRTLRRPPVFRFGRINQRRKQWRRAAGAGRRACAIENAFGERAGRRRIVGVRDVSTEQDLHRRCAVAGVLRRGSRGANRLTIESKLNLRSGPGRRVRVVAVHAGRRQARRAANAATSGAGSKFAASTGYASRALARRRGADAYAAAPLRPAATPAEPRPRRPDRASGDWHDREWRDRIGATSSCATGRDIG